MQRRSLPDFSAVQWATLVAVVLLAGFVRGFTGFGSALVMAPSFAVTVGPHWGVAIIALLNLATAGQLVRQSLSAVDWSVVGPMALAAVVGIPLGVWLLASIDAEQVTRLVSLAVIGAGIMLWVGLRRRGGFAWPVTTLVGLASGFLTGVGGIGGPPAVLYLVSGNEGAARSRASFIVYFAIIQAVVVVPLLVAGIVTFPALCASLALLPAYFISTQLGAALFGRMRPTVMFDRLVIGLLIGVGLLGLLA